MDLVREVKKFQIDKNSVHTLLLLVDEQLSRIVDLMPENESQEIRNDLIKFRKEIYMFKFVKSGDHEFEEFVNKIITKLNRFLNTPLLKSSEKFFNNIVVQYCDYYINETENTPAWVKTANTFALLLTLLGSVLFIVSIVVSALDGSMSLTGDDVFKNSSIYISLTFLLMVAVGGGILMYTDFSGGARLRSQIAMKECYMQRAEYWKCQAPHLKTLVEKVLNVLESKAFRTPQTSIGDEDSTSCEELIHSEQVSTQNADTMLDSSERLSLFFDEDHLNTLSKTLASLEKAQIERDEARNQAATLTLETTNLKAELNHVLERLANDIKQASSAQTNPQKQEKMLALITRMEHLNDTLKSLPTNKRFRLASDDGKNMLTIFNDALLLMKEASAAPNNLAGATT